MKVATIQSSYIPWRGYFDIIHEVDLFIFLEDVQYTERDWRNRNKIRLLNGGSSWITIPVGKVDRDTMLCDVSIKGDLWREVHYGKIRENYLKAPFYAEIEPVLSFFYKKNKWDNLSKMNQVMIKEICRYLEIKTPMTTSLDYPSKYKKSERIIHLLKQVGATEYLSGPSAKSYLEENRFAEECITLTYQSYEGYPEYQQIAGQFDPYVSVIDLMAMKGRDSRRWITERK